MSLLTSILDLGLVVGVCNDQFLHSPDMVPKGRLGLSLCAGPPVTGSTSDRGNVYGGIMVDIEAKGSPLVWELYTVSIKGQVTKHM